MTTLEVRCLDAFPDWLRSLADDARALASVLENEGAGGRAAALRCGAQLFVQIAGSDPRWAGRSGLHRRCIRGSRRGDASGSKPRPSWVRIRLARSRGFPTKPSWCKSFWERVRAPGQYVAGLDQGSARGRSVTTILADDNVRTEFVREVRAWARGLRGAELHP